MQIHHYDAATGRYLSTGLADRDALIPDGWIIPAYATPAAVPAHNPAAERAIYRAADGSIPADHRQGAWTVEPIPADPPPPEPDLADLQASACADIDAERARRALAPIEYAGSPFDADSLARERISGLILRLLRGDGLPASWIGWRGADNVMHWAALDADAVRVQISGLSSAIEDREQALLIAAWQHKAAVLALESAEAVQGYDISAGWPA